MSDFTAEEREAAAKKVEAMQQVWDTGYEWIGEYPNRKAYLPYALDLQCELTRRESQLREAIELLNPSTRCFRSIPSRHKAQRAMSGIR